MALLKLTIIILAVILQSSESKSLNKLTVMVSQSKPFAFHENGVLKGLDVNIVENFAKKLILKVNYILANESLNYVFSTEESFDKFAQSIHELYVILLINFDPMLKRA